MSRPARASLGIAAHTGWAAMIALAGPASSPEVLHRARIEMIAGEARFVYHAARALPLDEAERFVRASVAQADAAATGALAAALVAIGRKLAAVGLIVGERPVAGSLAEILASHSKIHAAEGQLYREALARACAARDLPVVAVPARELASRGAALLGVSIAALPARLGAIGRNLGPPWSKDQKDASIASLIALASVR